MKRKRLIAGGILLAIIISIFPGNAFAKVIFNYFPGIEELVIFEPGTMLRNESKETEINLPFDVESVTFKYDVESNKFVELKTIEESTSVYKYFDYGRYIRGMRIGDKFYIATDIGVFAYDYQSFEKTGEIKF